MILNSVKGRNSCFGKVRLVVRECFTGISNEKRNETSLFAHPCLCLYIQHTHFFSNNPTVHVDWSENVIGTEQQLHDVCLSLTPWALDTFSLWNRWGVCVSALPVISSAAEPQSQVLPSHPDFCNHRQVYDYSQISIFLSKLCKKWIMIIEMQKMWSWVNENNLKTDHRFKLNPYICL